jgi:FkbM family methyltransferase
MLDEASRPPQGLRIEDLDLVCADLGARGGLDRALDQISRWCSAIAFEPEPSEAERLSRQPDSRWRAVRVLPYAIGGVAGSGTLHLPADMAGASLLAHNSALVQRFGQTHLHIDRHEVPVETKTLDSLRISGELPRVDYLKIDVEGAEYAILQAASLVLSECSAIKVECSFLPQRLGQRLVWDVASLLSATGMEIVDLEDIHRWRRRPLPAHPFTTRFPMAYSRGQLAQCDVVALRSPEHVTDWPALLRLVVIASTLGFFDFAVTALRVRRDLVETVQDAHALERSLEHWSLQCGHQATRAALLASLRGMVPLLRSAIGALPFAAPAEPY